MNGLYPTGPLAGRPAQVGAQGAIVVTPEDAANINRNIWAGYVDLALDVSPRFLVSGTYIPVLTKIVKTSSAVAQALGAQPLTPEKSKNYSLGFLTAKRAEHVPSNLA